MKNDRKYLLAGIISLSLFLLWTLLVLFFDVKDIGPNGSSVGFAAINKAVYSATGSNLMFYYVTDWLSLLPLGVTLSFAVLGAVQLISGRSFKRVEFDIWALGGLYLLTATAFLIFEKLAVNFRPITLSGVLEVSYPSSTTLLFMTVLPSAYVYLKKKLKSRYLICLFKWGISFLTATVVLLRLFSGVHWFSDIIGSIFLSLGLFFLFCHFSKP